MLFYIPVFFFKSAKIVTLMSVNKCKSCINQKQNDFSFDKSAAFSKSQSSEICVLSEKRTLSVMLVIFIVVIFIVFSPCDCCLLFEFVFGLHFVHAFVFLIASYNCIF